MLFNTVAKNDTPNAFVANQDIVCHLCARKYSQEKRVSYSETRRKLKGTFTGQKVYRIPGARDEELRNICICGKCAEQIFLSICEKHEKETQKTSESVKGDTQVEQSQD